MELLNSLPPGKQSINDIKKAPVYGLVPAEVFKQNCKITNKNNIEFTDLAKGITEVLLSDDFNISQTHIEKIEAYYYIKDPNTILLAWESDEPNYINVIIFPKEMYTMQNEPSELYLS